MFVCSRADASKSYLTLLGALCGLLLPTQSAALFLLQEQRRFLAQYWKKAFRCLREEPRQRHFDAERVFQHSNARRRSLAERAHAEAQCISFPGLLLHRDQAEVTVGAREALLETANRFDLPEAMATMAVTVSLTEFAPALPGRAYTPL